MSNYYPVKASNVCFTKHHQGMWSRFQIVAWINNQLNSHIYKIEHLCTGAAYCCLMDQLFPGIINMLKVKFQANQEYEYLGNFRLVQNAFRQVRVDTQIPMAGLVRGRLNDNLEFASWFRRFFETNYRKPVHSYYDPVAARGSQHIGLGPYRCPTQREVQAMRRHRRSVGLSISRPEKGLEVHQGHVGYQIGEGDQLHSFK